MLDLLDCERNDLGDLITKLGSNFDLIKDYYNSLNADGSHFVNSNDICTPMECVKEMVDSIPKEFWDNPDIKVFDSCCGNGNFHGYIATKTKLSNLYFNEINQKRVANLKKYFGEGINLTIKDFLAFPDEEKYDLVVSNPPYAKFKDGKRTAKNHNLARSFIEKALKMTKEKGYILFIVPDNWMSYADRNILPKLMSEYQFVHLNIHGAKKWFPKVGSSFTWFLLQKTPNKKPFTVENNYFIKNKKKVTLPTGVDFIPLYYDDTVKSIIEKVVRSDTKKYLVETTSNLHKHGKSHFLSAVKDETYKYKIRHTPTQTIWSSVKHKYQDGYKVFISLTNQYGTFIDNCGMTQSIAFVRCDSLKEAENIQKELSSPVYRFVNSITRYGNFNNIRVLQNLAVKQAFRLDENEQLLINKFNGDYYGEKYYA